MVHYSFATKELFPPFNAACPISWTHLADSPTVLLFRRFNFIVLVSLLLAYDVMRQLNWLLVSFMSVYHHHHHHFILPTNKNTTFNNTTEIQLAGRQKNIKFMKLAPMLYTNTTK